MDCPVVLADEKRLEDPLVSPVVSWVSRSEDGSEDRSMGEIPSRIPLGLCRRIVVEAL